MAGGIIVTHPCSDALIFFGVPDFSFNYQNGTYALPTIDALLNGVITPGRIGFGLASSFRTLDWFRGSDMQPRHCQWVLAFPVRLLSASSQSPISSPGKLFFTLER